jgi:hypothetical protein
LIFICLSWCFGSSNIATKETVQGAVIMSLAVRLGALFFVKDR